LIEACEARFAGGLKGYILVAASGDPRHYLDAEGHARASYHDDTLFIVRPDNYVGLATEMADPVIPYLTKLLP
jgi:hypothetical protein